MKAAGIGMKGYRPRIAESAVLGPGKGRIESSPGPSRGAQVMLIPYRARGLLHSGGQKCPN